MEVIIFANHRSGLEKYIPQAVKSDMNIDGIVEYGFVGVSLFEKPSKDNIIKFIKSRWERIVYQFIEEKVKDDYEYPKSELDSLWEYVLPELEKSIDEYLKYTE